MRITIDQKTIDIPEGTTVLKAASMLGITIPTMCYMEGTDCNSSCMVCLVKDLSSGNMFPSCAMPAREGMNIQTHSPEIREMRRQALELLLGDHIGDCEAPCRLSCPAFMNIPLMNRLISGGHFTHALDIVREEIAIPLILGYICPAPCEKACHRKTVDEAVSICMLKRKTAQDDRLQPPQPRENAAGKERPVAVIGSGPAGLSAAFYLRRMGYDVTIYDKNPLPGGTLRFDIPEEELPREALNREIETIRGMGVRFISGMEVDADMFENEIVPKYKAIILATGNRDIHSPIPFSLEPDAQGNLVNRKTGGTNRPGIFGCGSLIKEQRMAVRSAAQGRLAALEADLYLNTGHVRRMRFQFHSAISHLLPDEEKEYLKEATSGGRIHPREGDLTGFSEHEAMKEAARCMHCDCRKPVTCQLRLLSDEYQANRKRFTGPERKNLKKYIRHDLIVYEPEKCIKCGRCVTITSQYKEELGLTFTGRGFDIRIGVPFGGTLQEGIKKSAFFCVENCPTGALAFKDQEEGVEYGKRMRLTKKGWSGILPALLIPGLLLISMFLPAQPRSAGCWSSYRGDAQLTGVSLAKVKSPLKLLWSYNTGDAVKSSPIVCNNSIYVGSNDGFLYALDLQGALLWKFNAGNSIESPPLLIGGQVIFGTLEGTIFSLDAADGKERWRYVTEGQISGAPNVVQTGKGKDFAIIAGSYDYNLHAVEGSTGKPLWKYETDNFINGTPAMFGKIAIFGGCDGHLHLVNTETGQLIDKIDIGTYMASSPSVSGTRVYFGNYDGEFFCFDMKTKKMVWKTDGGGPFLSSPAVSGKVAVIGSQNKSLYGYDTGSGKILWTFKALGKIDASPVIAGNRVIVASADGRLRILELPTGQESWSYEVGSPMYSTPAVTSGGIVVGADDGGVYMFVYQ